MPEEEKKEIQNDDSDFNVDKKGVVDKGLQKLFSRKLLVFLIATSLLIGSKLTSEHWVWCALVYITSQAMVDFVVSLKHGKK